MTGQADPVLRPLLSLQHSRISYCARPLLGTQSISCPAGTGTSRPGPSSEVAGWLAISR